MKRKTLTFLAFGFILYIVLFEKQSIASVVSYMAHNPYRMHCNMFRACTGFDRDLEDGEAIRRLMRQIANLKLNANDNYELAAA